MRQRIAFLLTALTVASFRVSFAETSSDPLLVPDNVRSVIATYCGDCHTAGAREGDVSLDDLANLKLDARLALLNKAQDQLFFKLMPPDDADQPSEAERSLLATWLRAELRKYNASTLDEKLRDPHHGNYVSHEKLFSGEVQKPAYTPARRWLVSPQIFHERVMDVFKLTGRDRDNMKHRSFYGVANPFLLPEHSGVRYYDLGSLDGGHLLVMLGNARWIADRQLIIARHLGGDRRKIQFENPKDRWSPWASPQSYEAFQKILLKEQTPSEDEMVAAIREQFDCVLRREPTEAELSDYLDLLRSAIALGNNEQGLRQMLVAVLLESEFLYRLEFGGDKQDEHGRSMLTPREASYAISYALGDRGPDETLVKAAQEGRLTTRQDFQREVSRLLADQQYYRGQIDPTLNGKHYRSNETSHPKILRFFREFFGYPGALKVFKDSKRSEGKYGNPGRGVP